MGLNIFQRIELDACTQCGECVKVCDSYYVKKDESVVVKGMIDKKRRALWNNNPLARLLFFTTKLDLTEDKEYQQGVYSCTLCGRCLDACPVDIGTKMLVIGMREELFKLDLHPANFRLVLEALREEKNVFGYSNEERTMWMDFMDDLPDELPEKKKGRVLYFVGCISSFSPAVQEVPQAFLEILIKAGIDVLVGGFDEWCCGFPLLAAGLKSEMADLVKHNLEKLKDTGADKIVFNCPSCFYTWSNYYKPEGVKLYHSTIFIKELIEEGKIRFEEADKVVAYHDPCDLGRGMGVYDPPRDIINSIPGVKLNELPENRERAYCCGGGGDVEMLEQELVKGINLKLVSEMEKTGAEIVLEACPQCKRTTQAGIKDKKSSLRVMDICEFINKYGKFQ